MRPLYILLLAFAVTPVAAQRYHLGAAYQTTSLYGLEMRGAEIFAQKEMSNRAMMSLRMAAMQGAQYWHQESNIKCYQLQLGPSYRLNKRARYAELHLEGGVQVLSDPKQLLWDSPVFCGTGLPFPLPAAPSYPSAYIGTYLRLEGRVLLKHGIILLSSLGKGMYFERKQVGRFPSGDWRIGVGYGFSTRTLAGF